MNKKQLTSLIIAIFLTGLLVLASFTYSKNAIFDHDCTDFQTREEAEKVFHRFKNDIYKLDADGDGIPCEKLPVIKYV